VNALLFLLVGWLAGRIGLPFVVDGFGPAFFGAIVVGVVAFVLHVAIPDRLDGR
jgi:putative membrane protein